MWNSENRHYLDEAVAQGKGVAILAAHIGNWEWLGAGLALSGFPVASIVKRQPNDQHTRILNEYRQNAGIQIFTRGTTELVAAAKALKQGKVLGFFTDQDGGPNGAFVNFLGKMSATPVGLAVFARKLQLPVVPVFIVRRPAGGHRIIVKPPLLFTRTEDEATDILNFTAQATQVVEEFIRQHPDEWLWFQKRWNTKWAGEQA
jgi:KDO2-lipid IV(A) lauroyltransferase